MDYKDAPLRQSQELEGKAFLRLRSSTVEDEVIVTQDIYRVENNKVYRLIGDNSGKWEESKDSLWELKSKCKEIGDYDPSKTYVYKSQWFDASFLADSIFNLIKE